ncbi:hypothetical protein BJ508DRAFT_350467 [Ascobolus immersus RN42]|uniref:Uncharacterized protein n=1 Tax=Ascobolus immersus RN42 TaxID=1160509 RepID=A0A3N4HWK6_ASCIM|nr:hypothetical protein BJ508DRAFT_350467 [Ascobolus immersus RN42]
MEVETSNAESTGSLITPLRVAWLACLRMKPSSREERPVRMRAREDLNQGRGAGAETGGERGQLRYQEKLAFVVVSARDVQSRKRVVSRPKGTVGRGVAWLTKILLSLPLFVGIGGGQQAEIPHQKFTNHKPTSADATPLQIPSSIQSSTSSTSAPQATHATLVIKASSQQAQPGPPFQVRSLRLNWRHKPARSGPPRLFTDHATLVSAITSLSGHRAKPSTKHPGGRSKCAHLNTNVVISNLL